VTLGPVGGRGALHSGTGADAVGLPGEAATNRPGEHGAGVVGLAELVLEALHLLRFGDDVVEGNPAAPCPETRVIVPSRGSVVRREDDRAVRPEADLGFELC